MYQLTPQTKSRIKHQLEKIITERVDTEASVRDLYLDGNRDLVISVTAEVVMGEAEIENSGPVEQMANDIAAAIVQDAKYRENHDWMMNLVVYHRWLRGEEPELETEILDRAIRTVGWMGRKRRRR